MVAAVDPERHGTLPNVDVKVNGASLPPSIDQAVGSITVDERLNAPTMMEIHFHLDPHHLDLIDDSNLTEGKEIEILAGYLNEEKSLCVGKITSVEVELDEQMPEVIIRGYDLSFGLHRDIKSRSFLNQTDSDIAKKIAGESGGLSAKVDATTEVYEYVLQYGQTNYEFLLERARRIGYELRVAGRELLFRKPAPVGTAIELQYGISLKRFSPRLSVAEQVDKVQVRAWDPVKKAAIVSTATSGQSATKTGVTQSGSANGQNAWGSASRMILNAVVASDSDATSLAQAAFNDIAASYVQATGECMGNPDIRVGGTVSIKGVGTRFSGDYYVTAARHVLTKEEGYNVFFTASTRDPSSLASLLDAPEEKPRAPHVLVGIVTNNDDPQKLGRVKVKFPTLFDQDESFWAKLVSPAAGANRGFFVVPEVNDEVVVAFEAGDPNRCYVIGSLWNSSDQPPKPATGEALEQGKVNQRLWRSKSGHLIVFDDTDGKEGIQIVDKTGKNHIIITSSDNKMDVELQGDITVTSKTGQISMTAQKDILIESQQGKVGIKGMTTAFEAQQSGTLKTGTTLEVNAGSSLTAKANASVEVSSSGSAKFAGATVDVQGQGPTNIKGAIVNIN